MQRTIRWIAIGVGAVLVVLAIVAGVGSRTETLRKLVVSTLADRLDSDVQLEWFSVDTFPSVDIRGTGLVVRLKDSGAGPPLLKIDSFVITGGMFGLLSRPRRFRTITLTGMEINIPPGGPDFKGKKVDAPDATPADAPSDSPIHIDYLESTDAVLRLIPRNPEKRPREFAIHRLSMTGVGVHQRIPFDAELTNPLPRGEVKAQGRFGPWARTSPGETPIDGKYTFDQADLGTIKGIGGILSSTGAFGGQLGRIAVQGETRTPDFHLSYAGTKMPLTTKFDAVVDGTDGDTYLQSVSATLGRTAMAVKGAIEGLPGVKGRAIKLNVKIDDGYIEDLLRLTVKSEPALTGRVALRADMSLPPGEADVIERLRLGGQFDLTSAAFTNRGVQEKLSGMSSRARGKDPETAAPSNVLTELEGKFTAAAATIRFSDLRFRIPGASVQLAGTYGLRSEALEFDGTLRMQATISEVAGGGMKSVFLKIVDPLFRKKGAGTVLPIRIRGTREDPKFGLDVVKALTPK